MSASSAFPANGNRSTGLPPARSTDVRLDPGDNQLWAAVQGFGVYSTLAPHRLGDPKRGQPAESRRARGRAGFADERSRCEGILGAGRRAISRPVLLTTDTESQIQIPFEASGKYALAFVRYPACREPRDAPLAAGR